MESKLEPIRPRLLPVPDVDDLGKVKGLFCESSDAWEQEDYKVFVQKLAEAFSLDIHDFTMVMNKHMQRACACVAMMDQEEAETIYFHTLKGAMSLKDCLDFTLDNGVPYNDHSRNFDERYSIDPKFVGMPIRGTKENYIIASPRILEGAADVWNFGKLSGQHCVGNTLLPKS
jgi:hypothetical protein